MKYFYTFIIILCSCQSYQGKWEHKDVQNGKDVHVIVEFKGSDYVYKMRMPSDSLVLFDEAGKYKMIDAKNPGFTLPGADEISTKVMLKSSQAIALGYLAMYEDSCILFHKKLGVDYRRKFTRATTDTMTFHRNNKNMRGYKFWTKNVCTEAWSQFMKK